MSQEKRTALQFNLTRGLQTFQIQVNLAEDLAGSNLSGSLQSVGTAGWVALNLGTVAAADLLCVVNTDAAHYVQLATDNAGAKIFAKLTPGRAAFFPPDPTVTIYAKANTAACLVQVLACDP
jgi:hypothetical protein